jgi:hypothetical protein
LGPTGIEPACDQDRRLRSRKTLAIEERDYHDVLVTLIAQYEDKQRAPSAA